MTSGQRHSRPPETRRTTNPWGRIVNVSFGRSSTTCGRVAPLRSTTRWSVAQLPHSTVPIPLPAMHGQGNGDRGIRGNDGGQLLPCAIAVGLNSCGHAHRRAELRGELSPIVRHRQGYAPPSRPSTRRSAVSSRSTTRSSAMRAFAPLKAICSFAGAGIALSVTAVKDPLPGHKRPTSRRSTLRVRRGYLPSPPLALLAFSSSLSCPSSMTNSRSKQLTPF